MHERIWLFFSAYITSILMFKLRRCWFLKYLDALLFLNSFDWSHRFRSLSWLTLNWVFSIKIFFYIRNMILSRFLLEPNWACISVEWYLTKSEFDSMLYMHFLIRYLLLAEYRNIVSYALYTKQIILRSMSWIAQSSFLSYW